MTRWTEGALVVDVRRPPSRHVLNVTAALVWCLSNGERSPLDIAAELRAGFPNPTLASTRM